MDRAVLWFRPQVEASPGKEAQILVLSPFAPPGQVLTILGGSVSMSALGGRMWLVGWLLGQAWKLGTPG